MPVSVPEGDFESRLRSIQETVAAVRKSAEDIRLRTARTVAMSRDLRSGRDRRETGDRRAVRERDGAEDRRTGPDRRLGPDEASADLALPLRDYVERLEAEIAGLRTAMQTRAVIEQAKGMIMMRNHCDADTAFQILVKASQHSHQKLVQVAQHVIEWGSSSSEAELGAF